MQLIQVQVISAQAAQTEFQVFPGPQAVPLYGFAGQEYLLSLTGKGAADFFFAVHVEMSGVVEIDAPFQGPAQHLFGFLKRQTNDGDGAETNFGHFQSGITQETIVHFSLPQVLWHYCYTSVGVTVGKAKDDGCKTIMI